MTGFFLGGLQRSTRLDRSFLSYSHGDRGHRRGYSAPQELSAVPGRQGSAEIVALSEGALVVLKEGELLRSFNAFGDHLHMQVPAHAGSCRPGDLMRRRNASPRSPGKRRRPSKSARLELRLLDANGLEREVCFATFDSVASLSYAGFKQITSKATVRCRTYAARIGCGIPLTAGGCESG